MKCHVLKADQARQAPLQTPQPDRDHVRASEGLATGRNAIRQVPEGLPLRRRPRRYRHVLAMMQERVLTLGCRNKGRTDETGRCLAGPSATGTRAGQVS